MTVRTDEMRAESARRFIFQYLREQREHNPEPEDFPRLIAQRAKRLALLEAERREKENAANTAGQ